MSFITKNTITGKSNPSQIPPNCILTLQEKIGERKALLSGIANVEEYFRRPRKIEPAIASYKLAAARARVEAFHELHNSLFKLGFYFIKIAKLLKKRGEDETPALKEALEYFTESFTTSNASGEGIEYKTIYMIIVLHIRLGDSKKGHPYIGVIDKIRTDLKIKQAENSSISLTVVDSWIDKCKRLWEDRESEELFK